VRKGVSSEREGEEAETSGDRVVEKRNKRHSKMLQEDNDLITCKSKLRNKNLGKKEKE
jgi:hypothetical protein